MAVRTHFLHNTRGGGDALWDILSGDWRCDPHHRRSLRVHLHLLLATRRADYKRKKGRQRHVENHCRVQMRPPPHRNFNINLSIFLIFKKIFGEVVEIFETQIDGAISQRK